MLVVYIVVYSSCEYIKLIKSFRLVFFRHGTNLTLASSHDIFTILFLTIYFLVFRPLGPSVTVVSEVGYNLVGLVGNLCKLTTDCSVCLSLR